MTVLKFVVVVSLLSLTCGPSPGQPDSSRYSSFIGGSEFVVGDNRFSFMFLPDELDNLEDANVDVEFYLYKGEVLTPKFGLPARYQEVRGLTPHIHDDGELHEHLDLHGVYIVDRARFDTPGIWTAKVVFNSSDSVVEEMAFQVLEVSVAPNMGQKVPATRNLTIHDVDRIEDIDSHIPPDSMHEKSVAQALEEGKPFVVVWSTPMFCMSAMCGPVTDQVISLQARYKERVNFIHIEPWDLNVARNEGRLVPTLEFAEWKLSSEPWVYVIGGDGRVGARFEGIVSSDEIETAIHGVLGRRIDN